MRQQEAEQEAARRNAEDERRGRFLFYALDHSAGLGDDAWEVEMRLRTDDDAPAPAAVPVAAAAPGDHAVRSRRAGRASRADRRARTRRARDRDGRPGAAAPAPAAADPRLGSI